MRTLFLIFTLSLFVAPASLVLAQASVQGHNEADTNKTIDPVDKYNVIDPERKSKDQASRFSDILSYEPKDIQKVPFEKIEFLIKKVRAESDQKDPKDPKKLNHQYCLFDITDGCYLRNALFKRDMARSGINLEKSTSSIIIKYLDKNKKWSFHSVAVVYTDKGPMVFDPDIKDYDQIFEGNLITPLATWLQVDWSHMNPIYTLAPPDYVHSGDFLNSKTVFKNAQAGKAFGADFWDNFAEQTPNAKIFQDVTNPPKLNDAQIADYLRHRRATVESSERAYKALKGKK